MKISYNQYIQNNQNIKSQMNGIKNIEKKIRIEQKTEKKYYSNLNMAVKTNNSTTAVTALDQVIAEQQQILSDTNGESLALTNLLNSLNPL